MKLKAKKHVFRAICALGMFLLLGSAGGIETDAIPLAQGAAQMLAGLAMFVGGAYLGGLMR